MKPRILIVNDDGIKAEGIKHLWESVVDWAEVAIVAPAEEQSGAGTSLTLHTPVRTSVVDSFKDTIAWHVNGTPATCVKMALSYLLPWTPDIILSGINSGSNIARNVLYSGTMGAVIEGAMRNIQGIAFSCEKHNTNKPNYTLARKHIPSIVKYVLENPMPQGTVLNVNVPDDIEEIKGIKMTRQGMEYWIENVSEREHPVDNKSYFWLGATIETFDESAENDSQVIRKGYITASPIHVNDLTDNEVFNNRKEAFESALNAQELVPASV